MCFDHTWLLTSVAGAVDHAMEEWMEVLLLLLSADWLCFSINGVWFHKIKLEPSVTQIC